jgi:hypothetical protein
MSLKNFHRVFIAAAFAGFAYVAFWATGHNAALLRTPWLLGVAAAGMLLLAPYFVWTLKKL